MSKSTKLPMLPVSFSAEVIRSDGPWHRIYRNFANVRMDHYLGEECRSISISLGDLGIGYNFAPATRTYSVAHFSPDLTGQQYDPDDEFDWVMIGEETANGIVCTKFDGRPKSRPGNIARSVLIDLKTGMRIIIQTFTKLGAPALTLEYRHIQIGPPPEDAFEPLEGYRLVSEP